MANLLLGVTGSIAAYKAVELTRLAMKAGHQVRVLQTETSQRFIGSATFEGVTGAPVLISEFQSDPLRGVYPGQELPNHVPPNHLELVERSDLYLIAPASANTLAKLATGIADNMVTSAALVASCPVLVAPAMNNKMYEHEAVQANLEALKSRGVRVIEPQVGKLASIGEWGVGRLQEPLNLLAECEATLRPANELTSALKGKKVLITAGGTHEPLDSVRYIGNRSSGKMGFALAREARRRGAEVSVVAANVSLAKDPSVTYYDCSTASELSELCKREFASCDVLLMAAAVADFTPLKTAEGKIKKGSVERLQLELQKTEDVLTTLAAQKSQQQTVVGFAAEHGPGGIENAREKLKRKGLDLVVYNDIADGTVGFSSDQNAVTIISDRGDKKVSKRSKDAVSEQILAVLETHLSL